MRVALVTGGNRGIGLICARRLAEEGVQVIVAGRDAEALERARAEIRGAEALMLDVTDEGAWEQVRERPIDILVASAGITEAGPIHRFSADTFRRLLEVNVIGVFLAVRAVMPGMRERGWGRIVAIASSASHHGIRYGSAYAASKHGLVGFIRSVATETAGTGVTANSVCPAVVDSQITDRGIARIMSTGRTEAEAKRELIASLAAPLGRFVQATEVAAAVAYFASEDTGAVTGQSLILDGGAVQQ
jgi:NAD(P)-dependent dehydrogenase (short-subunit alcohol dehydrogenase family)